MSVSLVSFPVTVHAQNNAPALCLAQLAPAVLQATLIEKNKLVRSSVRGQAPRSTTFQSTRTFEFDAAFPPAADTIDVFEVHLGEMESRTM